MQIEAHFEDADGFYNSLVQAHEGMSEQQSFAFNARLIFLLANQIGDAAVLADCIAAAAPVVAPVVEPEVEPELAAAVVPELVADVAPELAANVVPELVPEVASEVAPGTAPGGELRSR